MRFANPLWFFLLIPLALFIALRFWRKAKEATALPFSDLALLDSWIEKKSKEDIILDGLKILSVLLMIVALARPQKVSFSLQPPKPVVDIMLCMDTSISMAALDFNPDNRLQAAKKAAVEFIRKRPTDRLGLVVFGGEALLQCPLTLDHESLIEFIEGIELNATGTDGTAIGTALAMSASRLAETEAKSKVVILLTDGRSNRGNIDPRTAASAAHDLGIKIYTIGCAVPGGGQVPPIPELGIQGGQLMEDLDESTLSSIASETGAKYFRVTTKKKFKDIYSEINKLEKTELNLNQLIRTEDYYLSILIFSLIFLASSMGLRDLVWRKVP